jgi:hypothetical protein
MPEHTRSRARESEQRAQLTILACSKHHKRLLFPEAGARSAPARRPRVAQTGRVRRDLVARSLSAWSGRAGVPEPFEEGEESVGRSVAAGVAARECDSVKRALFEREVGVQVDVGSALLFVAQPERDRGRVDSGALSSVIAAVRRSTCIETRLEPSVGRVRSAVAMCLASRRSIPSRVSGPPWLEGNSEFAGWSSDSRNPDAEHRDGLDGERGDGSSLSQRSPKSPRPRTQQRRSSRSAGSRATSSHSAGTSAAKRSRNLDGSR